MDTWLNYHHLYYFRTIATEGSIARAAKVLRLGQPTLSAQLRQLEDRLGIRLFERQHRKLVLTEHGRIALEYASEIFRTGAEMVEVLHDRFVPTRLHVQIGVLDSISKHLTARLIAAAYRIRPCSISVLEGSDSALLRDLLAHRIDLILTNHPPAGADGRKLYVRSLAKLPVIACASPKFRALRKGFPKSLDRQPFVMPTEHSRLRVAVDQYLTTNNIQPDIVAETQDTSLQKILGANGIGVLPISEPAVRTLIKRGDLVKLGVLTGVAEELFLVAAARRIENPVARALLESFRFTA